ncbi:MAG: M15 family metallopeptidase [Actinomycetota bacterium]
MRTGPKAGVAGALLAGLVIGATATIAIQSRALEPARPGRGVGTDPVVPGPPERPDTFLAWTPNGLPPDFGARVEALPDIARVTVVAEDNTWLVRSTTDAGDVADRPPAPYMIPIDAAAVDTRTFADFLPMPDRNITVALARGEGVLGTTSAELRGLGPGATLTFDTGTDVRIAAVLPDELVGAAELLVSRRTGRRIGVHTDRYILLQPSTARLPTSARLTRRLRPLLPSTLDPVDRKVQVRAPGETPYFRQGDAVLPPVLLKSLFGEFAARPVPGDPGYLQVDPRWVDTHIVTVTIPVLGRVTCNRALMPQLRGAMQELDERGLASLIHTYNGCYVPRFINRIPTASISHHTWGVAFDCNAATNPFGSPTHQDARLVEILRRWGFTWGGDFIVPDGNHFEYRRPSAG